MSFAQTLDVMGACVRRIRAIGSARYIMAAVMASFMASVPWQRGKAKISDHRFPSQINVGARILRKSPVVIAARNLYATVWQCCPHQWPQVFVQHCKVVLQIIAHQCSASDKLKKSRQHILKRQTRAEITRRSPCTRTFCPSGACCGVISA